MKKLKYVLWAAGGVAAIMAGCAIMDLIWSEMISKEDLARSNNIRGVETCREMSHQSFQTWLIFNPKDRETYYIRSECVQRMAVRDRDEGLCSEVVERKSLYFDGSAISPAACREAVQKQKEQDLAGRVQAGTIRRIQSVSVIRTPAGDADVHVSSQGSLGGTYRLTLSLLDAEGQTLGKLAELETHMGGPAIDELAVIIYRRDVLRIAGPRFHPGERYVLDASLELLRDDAGQLKRSGINSDELISAERTPLVFE